MEVGPITPEIARELELPRSRGGAVVMDVERNSPAFNAGIRPNDVILEVNQQEVANVSQVQRELQRADAGPAGIPPDLAGWRKRLRHVEKALALQKAEGRRENSVSPSFSLTYAAE